MGILALYGFFKRPNASNGNSSYRVIVEGGGHDVNAMTIELLGVETTVDGLLASSYSSAVRKYTG